MASIFSIEAAPGTDIWRKPPQVNVFNAPTHPPLPPSKSTGPLSSFVSARLTFALPWSVQYDQAGLLLSFRKRSAASGDDSGKQPPAKWIKTGVEFYNGDPRVSAVACDTWADWSVAPLAVEEGRRPGKWTTVQIERAGDHHGPSLWVYQVLEGGEKRPLREVCWVYGNSSGDGLGGDDWDVAVEAYAARPGQGEEALKAEIKDFVVQWDE